jgi:phage tail-like protein
MGVNEASYEILENGAGKFKIEIDGCPVASANVESITMEDLVIDEREMTTGADWDYRVYGPGDAHFGSITIRSRMGKNSKEIYQWWLDCSKGANIRKNIAVVCNKRDTTEARRFNIFDAFPTKWNSEDYSPSSNVACETVTCKMQRVELAT